MTRAPRSLALVPVALLAGAGYLTWRLLATRAGAQPLAFWVLWLAEATIWVGLARVAWDAWTLRSDPRHRTVTDRSVDVVVICKDEPLDVLRATFVGCHSLTTPHRTVVVDTLGRSDLDDRVLHGADLVVIEGLAPDDGIDVVLRALLPHLDGELLTVLAGDVVPLPTLLDELVGDFEDPEVWLAQGRHAVYGPSPGEYRRGATEQELFFRIAEPGKNSHGAAYWCGSGGVVRRSTLEELLPTTASTDTPDFQLSIAAVAAGMRSTYHDRAVVMTLARPDIDGFLAQRSLWAHGNLQSLRTRQSPLWARGIPLPTRASYLGTIGTYLSGPRRLAMVAVLCALLVGGVLPLRADPVVLVGLWGIWMGLLVLAHRRLGRGITSPVAFAWHRWLLVGAYVGAWAALLVPRRVTRGLRTPVPSTGTRSAPAHRRLRLVVAIAVTVAVCALARIATAAGLLGLPELPPAATGLCLAASAVLVVALVAIVVGTARRSRRRTPRFAVEATASVGSTPHRLLDMAEGGASVRFDRPPTPGAPLVVSLRLPGLDGSLHQATVAAEIRSVRRIEGPPGSGWAVGIAFTHLSSTARERITEFCRVLLPARIAADVAALEHGGDEGPIESPVAAGASETRAG